MNKSFVLSTLAVFLAVCSFAMVLHYHASKQMAEVLHHEVSQMPTSPSLRADVIYLDASNEIVPSADRSLESAKNEMAVDVPMTTNRVGRVPRKGTSNSLSAQEWCGLFKWTVAVIVMFLTVRAVSEILEKLTKVIERIAVVLRAGHSDDSAS
jgi:hypothetical protein